MRKNAEIIAIAILFIGSCSTGFAIAGEEGNFQDIRDWIPDFTDRKPNVIIIGVDRLRTDNMPCYGYERNTTFYTCKLAEEGTLYKNSYAQATWTPPSVSTLITSRYPPSHEVNGLTDKLSDKEVTLAEVLRSKGYDTAAFLGNKGEGNNGALHKGLNLDQGFETYGEEGMYLKNNIPEGIDWLQSNRSKQPFFLYVQGYEPHRYSHKNVHVNHMKNLEDYHSSFGSNYSGIFHKRTILKKYGSPVPAIYWNRSMGYYLRSEGEPIKNISERDVDHIKDHYDIEVKSADEQIGEMLRNLKKRGLYNNSIIIIYSSHGENWDEEYIVGENNERAFFHGVMQDSVLKVPLIIKRTNPSGKNEERITGLIDLMPSIIEWTGLDIPEKTQKRIQGDIIPVSKGENFEYAYSERNRRSVVWHENWKLIKNPAQTSESYHLYNTSKPDDERENQYPENKDTADKLRDKLQKQRTSLLKAQNYN